MNTVPNLPFGLRRRLTLVFLIIILGLSFLNSFNLIWIAAYFSEFSGNLIHQENLQNLISSVRKHQAELFNYSRSVNPEYLTGMADLKIQIQSLVMEELARSPGNSRLRYRLRDISRMVETLFETEDLLYRDADRGISVIYLQDRGDELDRLSNYIISALQLVAEDYMQVLSAYYQEFSLRMNRMRGLSFALLILAMFFAIFTARRFVQTVSRPIHQLAIQLVRFGEGDFEARVGEIGARDEIAVLVRSYDNMADRIRVLISDIRDKAELETRLVEQRLATQEAERLLKEAELARLHAQINPHFLFNTLNIIGSLCRVEGALRTGAVISDLSELLRYSLRTGTGTVKLQNEIDVFRSYMNIQKLRFENKISYEEQIDPELIDVKMPGMVLQPLAENAVKHGLEPILRPGRIFLSVSRLEESTVVVLKDNGIGISDKALALLKDTSVTTESLGIRNVRRRLALYYGRDVLEIFRDTSGGTVCRIVLPDVTVISGG